MVSVSVPRARGENESAGRMRTVYIAAPFSSRTSRIEGRLYGELNDVNFIRLLERVEEAVKAAGFHVFLPHRDEGKWGKHYIDPDRIAKMCFDLIAKSDIIVAIPKKSRGVHIELGWALGLKKKVLVFLRNDEDESIFMPGLHHTGSAIIKRYADESDLVIQVSKAVCELAYRKRDADEGCRAHATAVCALVDIGSSTLKLYVAEIMDHAIRHIHTENNSEVVLSDDVNSFGEIQERTFQRVAEILRGWKRRVDSYGGIVVGAVGCEAIRLANNGARFIQNVEEETGIELRVLTDEEEREAVYEGAIYDFPTGMSPLHERSNNEYVFAVLNVGGGTTDFVVGDKEEVHFGRSFQQLGIRKLNEFLAHDPPSEKEYWALTECIRRELAHAELPTLCPESTVFIHTGGELDYVQAAGCPLRDSSLSPSHPKEVAIDDFVMFAEALRKMKKAELYAKAPDLTNPTWMDGAIASNALAIGFAQAAGITRIIPSNRNIADGLLLQLKERRC